jgi:uncharacterized protein VirK/YbjX
MFVKIRRLVFTMKSVLRSLWFLTRFAWEEAALHRRMALRDVLKRVMWMLLNLRDHLPLFEVLDGQDAEVLASSYFRIPYRRTLPYLSTAFDERQRTALARSHAAFVSTRMGTTLFAQITHTPLLLWSHPDPAAPCTVTLAGPCPHREGGFTLQLRHEGTVLYRLAFSVVDLAVAAPGQGATGMGVVTGQVQGLPGQFQGIREATRACQDIAPPDLLMAMLHGVADALGLDQVRAVRFEHCLSYLKMTQLPSHFDYAGFWQARWGAIEQGAHYAMRLPYQEKPLAEVQAKHRKRTQLKRAFKREAMVTARVALAAQLAGVSRQPVGALRPALRAALRRI